MSQHDLFEAETRALQRARQACNSDEATAGEALKVLITEFEKVIREMRRLINHADRSERELNNANQKLLQLTDALAWQNRHDSLTGLLNRSALITQAEQWLTQGPLALILVDIDHFKHINDRYGHPVGDEVLIAVATALGKAAGDQESCGRMGGEEFAILLPTDHPEPALQLAQAAAEGVRRVYCDSAPLLRVTASFGLALSHPTGNFNQLYQSADDALYQAKHNGRDCIEVIDTSIGAPADSP